MLTTLMEQDPKDTKRGIYQNPAIFQVLKQMWFKNDASEGTVEEAKFNPIPLPTIALIVCAVRGYNLPVYVRG